MSRDIDRTTRVLQSLTLTFDTCVLFSEIALIVRPGNDHFPSIERSDTRHGKDQERRHTRSPVK